MSLMDKVQHKTAVIGVVGLGYVGLPLAISFAEAGFHVIGIDNQQSKLDTLCKGESYIADVYSRRVRVVADLNRFQAINWGQSVKADIFIICVPTPITEDKKPDLSYIIETTKQIASRLAIGDSMVVLESSTYPGTTRDVVLPILAGSAKYVAYSPERVDPGSKKFSLKNTPKLVAGIDKESTELATLLYGQIVDTVVPVASLEVAETAKLYENVFRNVNIALANEMALICEKIGVSVWEVIDAASTKPFGFMPFYPGVGVGGHCIPVDPYYLTDKAQGASTRLITTALAINEVMPINIARQVVKLIPDNYDVKRVLVLGIAFKRDVNDIRESPSVELLEILQSWGIETVYNDPYIPRLTNHRAPDMESMELSDDLLDSADCVVIATDHSCYDYQRVVDRAKLVFDTRNATKGIVSEKIYKLGERKTE